MNRLRLFLLNTVLFPGMSLSLQVFEDRYRALVSECLEATEPFGVALIRDGKEVGEPAVPYSMGTTARIMRVIPTNDGRLLLQTRGERRFRIQALHHDRPYPSADVEYPLDEAGEPPADLLKETRRRYEQLQRLRHTMANEYRRHINVPEGHGPLADAVGAVAQGAVAERELQRLLETLDTRKRLERAADILGAAMTATHRQTQIVVAQRWAGIERQN